MQTAPDATQTITRDSEVVKDIIAAAEQIVLEATGEHLFRNGADGSLTARVGQLADQVVVALSPINIQLETAVGRATTAAAEYAEHRRLTDHAYRERDLAKVTIRDIAQYVSMMSPEDPTAKDLTVIISTPAEGARS